MRQSLAQFEQAFYEESMVDRQRRERLASTAQQRARKRELEKIHKRGSFRFLLLVLTLIATAVVVTIVMFRTLYVVMG
jgi:cell division septal protein FtsQ